MPTPVPIPRHVRRGFTATELVVVLSVAVILTGMAAMAALPAIRRAKLNSMAGAVEQVWARARSLAISTNPPTGATPNHYGVLIRQNGPSDTYVALIWSSNSASNVISGADNAMLHQDPADTSTPPALKIRIPSAYAFSWSTGSSAPTVTDGGGLVWYAQYRTGVPIDAANVAAGTGGSCAPIAIGTGKAIYPVATALRAQTLDWDPVLKRGLSIAISIYPVGIAGHEEL